MVDILHRAYWLSHAYNTQCRPKPRQMPGRWLLRVKLMLCRQPASIRKTGVLFIHNPIYIANQLSIRYKYLALVAYESLWFFSFL